MVLRRKPPTVMKAKLMQKTWMGEDIVVWCDENGRVCVAEAFCQRLGSHLGRDRLPEDAYAMVC